MTVLKQDSPKRQLIVVDDDEQIIKQIQWALSGDYEVFSAGTRVEALDLFREKRAEVVLLDLGLPPRPREPIEGLAALEEMNAENPLAKIIVVSGNSERENMLAALHSGAHDIFPKPIDLDQLRVVLSRAFTLIEFEAETSLQGTSSDPYELQSMLGDSPLMRDVFRTIAKISPKQVPVLITGESGTGKECVATAIHRLSHRAEGPLVPINCGAIPENLLESELFGHEKGAFTSAHTTRVGKLEHANGGTLFLDEVAEMPHPLQVKLLRFLQERTIERVGGHECIAVDTRIVAATNVNLEQCVSTGRFREDLYFRLAVVPLEIPPLRDRGDDVLVLANHFVSLFVQELDTPAKTLSPQAIQALRSYSWPGNVRELQNRLKRAVVLADGTSIATKDLELLPNGSALTQPASSSLKKAKEKLERTMVQECLALNDGNISRSARTLGISRPTLYDIISKHGL